MQLADARRPNDHDAPSCHRHLWSSSRPRFTRRALAHGPRAIDAGPCRCRLRARLEEESGPKVPHASAAASLRGEPGGTFEAEHPSRREGAARAEIVRASMRAVPARREIRDAGKRSSARALSAGSARHAGRALATSATASTHGARRQACCPLARRSGEGARPRRAGTALAALSAASRAGLDASGRRRLTRSAPGSRSRPRPEHRLVLAW